MVMSDSEILRQYRDAKNKKAQVGILADLNCCTKKEISEKLASLGVLNVEQESPFGKQFEELYNQGMSDAEIAEKMGAPKSDVTSWRRDRGLKANYPKRETKPKEEPKAAAGSKVKGAVCEAVTYRFTDDCVSATIDMLDKTVTIITDDVAPILSFQTAESIAQLIKEL